MFQKKRKKSWQEKVKEVFNSYYRCEIDDAFTRQFYKNLFFLNPKIEKYFDKTDWIYQRKALVHALDNLFHFLDDPENTHKKNQIIRIAKTHSKKNLNIHPHDYYYWIDALILTIKKFDNKWYNSLEFYFRECLFFPISFIISLYHKEKD
ncbi:MAG: hypothetical protein N4A33_01955 [Bacteriovoracaceae bacterium]|jgi:hypothetical protein|nr:hypothetical protein [Bacteriovoracaceae bacterium]